MTIPTRGEEYAKLMEYLRRAQESCATIAHLHQTEDGIKDRQLAMGWLAISELLKQMQDRVTKMAMGRLQ